MGQIYRHISPNGKSYIGRTIYTWQIRAGTNPASAYAPKFRNAILKYGWENFSHVILEEIEDFDLLCEREMYWIEFLSSVQKGYNSIGLEMHSEFFPTDTSWSPDLKLLRSLYIDERFSTREMVEFFNKDWTLIRLKLIENDIEIHKQNFRPKSREHREREKSWIGNRLEIDCAEKNCSNLFLPNRKNQTVCSKSCSGKLGYEKSMEKMTNGENRFGAGAPLNNQNAIGNKGGVLSMHNRWHLARNLVSPNCEHCGSP